jgi:2',3'-cyclic-nucleotide 2'-phosphodiesterase (5'-nucleotidase family)
MGGFARRMAYWNAFAKKYAQKPFLKLDGGSLFSNGTLESPIMNRWMLEGTYRCKLDAIGLSTWDIPVWQELGDLAKVGQISPEWLNLPLVSANVKPKVPNFPALKRYIIREIPLGAKGGRIVRVGITGILFDPEERVSREEFEIADPDQATRDIIQEMQGKTDYRIVLSDYTIGRAISLAVNVPGISLLLVSHDYAAATDAQQIGDSLVIVPVNESRMLSEVRLGVDPSLTRFNVQTRFVPLDRSIPDDPEMADLQSKALAEVQAVSRKLK